MNGTVYQLGQVCRTTSGGTPSRTRREYFGGSIPWVKSGDLTDGTVSDCEETITEEGLAKSSAKLFPKGTVLIAMYGATVGKLGVLGMEAATNQAICGITPSEKINPTYLYFFLLSQRQNLISLSTGGAQPNISQKILRDLAIPVPSIGVQKRIIDLLTRATTIVELRRAARGKGEQIARALFADMFGDPATNSKVWPIQLLGDVILSADYGSSTKASDSGRGVPLIRMGNVDYQGRWDLSSLKFVELTEKEESRYRLEQGDILFNRTNSKDLVGKTGIWDLETKAVVASYFIRIRVNPQVITPRYLWAFMNSSFMKERLFDTARGAIGQANINSKELKAFPISVPPLDLQKSFEDRLAGLRAIEEAQKDFGRHAETVFQSLLSQNFPPASGSNAQMPDIRIVATS